MSKETDQKLEQLKVKIKEVNELCFDILTENSDISMETKAVHAKSITENVMEENVKENFALLRIDIINHY